MPIQVRSLDDLEREGALRLLAYAPGVSWWGRSGVIRGLIRAAALLAFDAERLYLGLLSRYTLGAAAGDDLDLVAAERGAERGAATRARVLAVPLATSADVLSVVAPVVEVPLGDGALFAPTSTVTLRTASGVAEQRTVVSVSSGTGPNGGDEVTLSSVTGTYSPVDGSALILNVTIPAGTVLTSTSGITFQTSAAIVTGTSNPILAGARAPLALADKVWSEATQTGSVGNIDPDTLIDSSPAIPGVLGWYNPERGQGGGEEEADGDLRWRAANAPSICSQETPAWIEAQLQALRVDVARAFVLDPTLVNQVRVVVLSSAGAPFTSTVLAELADHLAARMRSGVTVSVDNVTLTAVEVEATVTLSPGVTLRDAWNAASARLASYLDWRRWGEGETVDEAVLLSIVRGTSGIASLETSTFLPSADVVVADGSVPTLARVSLRDAATGDTINALLAVSFG